MLIFVGRIRGFVSSVVRLGGTPSGIAGGFTLGLCLSLVPIPGAGMLVALALAPLLRCNLPATYLGTVVVNPLTGAFIYFAELAIGMVLLGREMPRWSSVRELGAWDWFDVFVDLLGPFAVGAAALIIASGVVFYPLVRMLARRFQRGARAA
jgi:uncharacterized protein (DUF2062 family)